MKSYEVWYKYKDKEYRLVDFLSHYRDEVKSRNLGDVKKTCDRLNFIAASDEIYEIREIECLA